MTLVMAPFGTFNRLACMQDWPHWLLAAPTTEMTMKAALLPLALLLASGAAQAHSTHDGGRIGCDVKSDYSVRPYRQAFLFSREGSTPAEIGIGGGRLFIDGKEISLVEADHARLREMEGEMKAMAPQIEKVMLEAIEIAFTALTEVARGLSNTPEKTVAGLERSHRQMMAEIRNKPMGVLDGDAMEAIIEPTITKFVPDIVGGAVSTALKAAFSGEAELKKFEARIKQMESELDTRVEARAKALEPLADALCQRLNRLDSLDDALEYRLPSGEPMQLLSVDPSRHKH
jgi:hypothetical protein